MKAVRLHGAGDLRVEEIPDPVVADDEVLLAVRAVGVCGSDLHHYLEGAMGSTRAQGPFVLGHEIAAEVVDGGPLPAGTLVAVDPARPCGACAWCVEGHRNLCPNVLFAGVPPRAGALAEYLTARPDELISLPDGFGPDVAALLEPLGVAIHAVGLAGLKPMTSVAILGAGPIGLAILQVARWSGAGSIVVVEPVGARRALARELGADAAVATPDRAVAIAPGRGFDVVLEATDAADGPQHAAEVVRIGGRVVLVGIPQGDRFTLGASLVRRKGLTIKTSRRMGDVFAQAIAMVRSGKVRLEALVTHRFGLDGAPEAFELQASRRDGVVKCLIEV